MRDKLILGCAALCLMIFGFEIYKKEQIIKNGRLVYFELAPRDPRSIMQGDYMALRYEIAQLHNKQLEYPKITINITVDNKGVMQHATDKDAKTSTYHVTLHPNGPSSYTMRPDTFLFQEGHAALYERARYGMFKIDKDSNKLLVGLADKNLKELRP
jgi:uncharacterized membrane-anchored protein